MQITCHASSSSTTTPSASGASHAHLDLDAAVLRSLLGDRNSTGGMCGAAVFRVACTFSQKDRSSTDVPCASCNPSSNARHALAVCADSALIFFLVANPETYKLTEMVFGSLFKVSNGGCPTPAGLFLHSIVFFFVLLGLMLFPRDI